jgi:hypothetical protein
MNTVYPSQKSSAAATNSRLPRIRLLLLCCTLFSALMSLSPRAHAWNCGTTVFIQIQGNLSICLGDSVILSGPVESGMTYVWKNASNPISGATNSSLTVKTAGDYRLVISSGGCTDSSHALTVTTKTTGVNAQHTPNGALAFCEGSFRQLSKRIVSGAGSYSFQWYRNDTLIPGETGSQLYITEPGSYTLQLTDINNGCVAFSPTPTVATMLPKPQAVISPSGPEVFICEEDTVTLSANTAFIKSYAWEKDGMLVWDQSTFEVTGGMYRVIMVDSNNCTDTSDLLTVTELSRPTATITPAADTAFCDGQALVLNAATSDTGIVFRWKNGNTAIANASQDSLVVTHSGAYSVVLSRNGLAHCADSTSEIAVTVHPLPQPVVTWNDSILSTDQPYVAYQWYMNGQTAGANATDREFRPRQDGSYTVSVTDSNGCTNTSAARNVVLADDHVGIYSSDDQMPQVNIFPNPVGNTLHIQTTTPVSVTVTAMDGKAVLDQNAVRGSLAVGHLPAGVYVIRVTDAHGLVILQQKLIRAMQ